MNYSQKITLRTFLKSTTSYAGAVAASERITVGFIGTGSHGIAMNLKGFLAQPDAQPLLSAMWIPTTSYLSAMSRQIQCCHAQCEACGGFDIYYFLLFIEKDKS
jgi:hypothetical protein